MIYRKPPMSHRCGCDVCRRSNRIEYVLRLVARTDDVAALWLSRLYDHLLDVETTVQMYEYERKERS